jgi:putative ABC transport system ATP-binding protein
MSPPLLEVRGVTKYYGHRIGCKDVSFDLWPGEVMGIVGESGSGKSTLLNIIGILDELDSGEYTLDGIEIKDLTEKKAAQYRNKFLGFVFQSFNLIFYFLYLFL